MRFITCLLAAAISACASSPADKPNRREPDPPTYGSWRVLPLPADIDLFRGAVYYDDKLALVPVQRKDDHWRIAPDASPNRLDGSAEFLGIDTETRTVTLLLGYGATASAWCKSGPGVDNRRDPQSPICTTGFSRARSGAGQAAWSAFSTVASMGLATEETRELDADEILKALVDVDLETHLQEWLAEDRRRAWGSWYRPVSAGHTNDYRWPWHARRLQRDAVMFAGQNAAPTTKPRAVPITPSSDLIGAQVCRDGLLTFQSCMNPAFPSSCVPKFADGQLKAFLEGFSPDRTRVQLRVKSYALRAPNDYPMHSTPSLGGIAGEAGTVMWDAATNWFRCEG
jgi:hypothetical protein